MIDLNFWNAKLKVTGTGHIEITWLFKADSFDDFFI